MSDMQLLRYLLDDLSADFQGCLDITLGRNAVVIEHVGCWRFGYRLFAHPKAKYDYRILSGGWISFITRKKASK